VVLGEQHYKSGVCVLHEHALFVACGAYEDVRAYEDGEPCALPQHSAALLIVML